MTSDQTITKATEVWKTIIAPIEQDSEVYVRFVGPALVITGRVAKHLMPIIIGRQGATMAAINRLILRALPTVMKVRVSMAEPDNREALEFKNRPAQSLDAATSAIFDLVKIDRYHITFREEGALKVLDVAIEHDPGDLGRSALIADAIRVIRAGAYINGGISVNLIEV